MIFFIGNDTILANLPEKKGLNYKSGVELGNRFNPNKPLPVSKFYKKKNLVNFSANYDLNLYSQNWFKTITFDIDWEFQIYRYTLYWKFYNNIKGLDSSLVNFLSEYYKQDFFGNNFDINNNKSLYLKKLFGNIQKKKLIQNIIEKFIIFL